MALPLLQKYLDFYVPRAARPPATVPGAFSPAGGMYSGAVPTYNQEQYLRAFEQVGWVYAVVDRISTAIAHTKWQLYKKAQRRSEREEVISHPILDLLSQVNPFETGFEHMELTQYYLELAGEAFWVLLRNGLRGVSEMWSVLPTQMEVVSGREKFVSGYVYSSSGGRVPLLSQDVIHFKRTHPRNRHRGLSPVSAIMTDIESQRYTSLYNRNFFRNSAEPGGVIEVEGNLTDEQFQSLVTQFREEHGGVANAHRVAVLEGGAKWQERKVTQREMQFRDLRKENRDVILAEYGVPLHILGIAESVNRANADAAEYVFARWVILPRLVRIREKLNEQLLPQFDTKGEYELDFDDPVPENREFQLERARGGYASGYMTKNEARALEGLDPDPAGDVYLVPNSGAETPIRSEPPESVSPAPPAPAEEVPPVGAEAESLYSKVVSALERIELTLKNPGTTFGPSELKALEDYEDLVRPFEERLERQVRSVFLAQEQDVLRRLSIASKHLAGQHDQHTHAGGHGKPDIGQKYATIDQIDVGDHVSWSTTYGGNTTNYTGTVVGAGKDTGSVMLSTPTKKHAAEPQYTKLTYEGAPGGSAPAAPAKPATTVPPPKSPAPTSLPPVNSGAFTENEAAASERFWDEQHRKGLPPAWESAVVAAKQEVSSKLVARLTGDSDFEAFAEALHSEPMGGMPAQKNPLSGAAARAVHAWAMTSDSGYPLSIAMQIAAQREFGLSSAVTKHFSPTAIAVAQSQWLDKHEKGMRKFLRAQHDETQEYFRGLDVKEVLLWRGTTQKAPTTGKSVVPLQPLSSFTTASGSTQGFTGSDGRVIAARVPVARILSTPRTGFGCLGESEMVVLGGKDRMVTVPSNASARANAVTASNLP